MHSAGLDLGETGADQIFLRRPHHETPEFDVTAMVDLVFMMNIYFLVTFITIALGELSLPSADNVTALDVEAATVFTLVRAPDGKGVVLYVGGGEEGDAHRDPLEQEQVIETAITQGLAAGKKDVLLKAEQKVRLAELFRIATAASLEGTKLHVGVLEKEAP
jgi:biopolymer transport protein ExbD